MSSRRYLNFDLLLEQEAPGQYQALVTGSPLGETPSVRFGLPFDATTLENLLLKLDPGRSGTRRVGATSQQQAAMDFGGPLYEAIFRDDLLLAWTRSQDQARQQAAGLRLRLRVNDAPAIAGLPWELLYDVRSNNFLAQSERTPVVRFLDVPQVPRPITVDGPLRVLAIISAPTDLDELDVEAEWQRIQEALAPRASAGLVVVDRLATATVLELGAWLRRHQTHVIHFVGHGDFDERLGEGVVYFQDRQGRSSPVSSSVLGPYVRDHDPLRMVVLNACRSARTDARDPFGGMAQGLVQQDATAVVAMQFPISDRAAVTFTGEFYGALVDGLPVDQAMSSARKSLLADFRDEWATPVLFLRSPDGNIFENLHAVAAGVDVEPVTQPVTQPVDEPVTQPVDEPVDEPVGDPVDPTYETLQRAVDSLTGGADDLAAYDAKVRTERRRRILLAAGAGALVLLVAAVAWWAWPGDDEVPVSELGLPASAPLPDTQLLVAAGDVDGSQHIWLVDTDSQDSTELTGGQTREWLPVLSPDRRSVVYSRSKDGTNSYVLHVAGAADGAGDRPLFEQTPAPCAKSQGRPAWSLDDPTLIVLRCRSVRDEWSLLLSTLDGRIRRSYTVAPDGVALPTFGDMTLTPDGRTIVLWGSTAGNASGGSLYAVDVADGSTRLLLKAQVPQQFSDAVFSPDGRTLAFRMAGTDGNFDIAVAAFDGTTLGPPQRLTTEPERDEDPTFSPDGTRIAFNHQRPGLGSRLYEVPVDGSSAAQPLLAGAVATVESVPAWSRR